MTVTIHLNPEIKAGRLAKAQASGMALEEYLLLVVAQTAREHAVRQMLEFGEKHRLSLDQSVTRELLHEGHRF